MFGKTKMQKNNETEEIKDNTQNTASADNNAENTAADQELKENKNTGEKTPEELLAQKVADLEKKLAEAENRRLLALAEMDNQRKRFAKEMENLRHNTTQDTLFPFLQVFDHFTMAVAASANSDHIESLKKGMEMIQQEFDKAFADLGVEKIDALNKEFDPKLHDAVAQEASDTVPEGKVIRQWCAGYKMNDRLLKAASVVVSSGPAKKEETEVKAEESASENKEN